MSARKSDGKCGQVRSSAVQSGKSRAKVRQAPRPAEDHKIIETQAVVGGVQYKAVVILPAPPANFEPESLPYWGGLSISAKKFLKEDIPYCQEKGLCVFCYATGRTMEAHPGRAYCLHHLQGAKDYDKLPLAYTEILLHKDRVQLSEMLHAGSAITSEEGLLFQRQARARLTAVEGELLKVRRYANGQCVHCGETMPPRDRGIEADRLTPGRKPQFFCTRQHEQQDQRERTGRKKPEDAHPKAVRARERYQEIVKEGFENAGVGLKPTDRILSGVFEIKGVKE